MPAQDLLAAPVTWLAQAVAQRGGGLATTAVFLLAFALAVAAIRPLVALIERLGRAGLAAAALVAVGLAVWLVQHPSREPLDLMSRFDHLVFAVTAGQVLVRLPTPWRVAGLAAVSLVVLLAHLGPLPMAVAFGTSLVGFLLLRVGLGWSDVVTTLVQGGVLLAGYATCFVIRSDNVLAGLSAQGPLAFVALRHISLVVETRRGRPASLADWACYQGFYTNSLGAVEVYDEFHGRNLAGPVQADLGGAQRRLAWGIVGVAAAMHLPVVPATGSATTETLALWGWCGLAYLRSALYLMSIWMMAEGAALLYGVTLRPNWPRTLLAENPAQLWRAWRATMTNWLIRYVYIPLGGRERRSVAVAGAFGVSVLWHWAGIPFLSGKPALIHFLPVLCWGVLNAAAVIGWGEWRRRVGPPSPSPVRRAMRIAGTFVLGTFTVTLLGFAPNDTGHFAAFLRRLTGLPPLREIAAALAGLVD
ncbi:MAG: hypothetical protein KIT14_05640 [bacterium]|nr:hypothetical protein [bacterium]